MLKVRKIQIVTQKLSFKDAEESDNLFWKNATHFERYLELVNLRNTFFSSDTKIKKAVNKFGLHEKK
jgi:hypothetical protein